jgi:hypothetical protein
MKVRKGLKATIVAMAALTGTTAQEECAAAAAAFADMANDGQECVIIDMNPFGDFVA